MTTIHENSAAATLECAQRIAGAQAERLAAQTIRIRDLIGERDTALSKRDDALALAAEYGRRSGLDITHDQITTQLKHEQRLLTHYDRRNHALEGFHRVVWQLDCTYLQPRLGRGLTVDELQSVHDRLVQAMDACGQDKPGPREKAGQQELFATTPAALQEPADPAPSTPAAQETL